MVTLQDFRKDLSFFVEIALIAIKQGDEESAKKLFNAVGVLDPKNMAKKMGYGLISLYKMDIKIAKKHFQEVLQVEKTNWRAQAFLSFAHMLNLLQEGTTMDEKKENLMTASKLALEVIDKSDDASTKQLAQSVLDWEEELQVSVIKKKNP